MALPLGGGPPETAIKHEHPHGRAAPYGSMECSKSAGVGIGCISEFGPERVKTRNGADPGDTHSRSEVRIIGCRIWNINFEEDFA